MIVMRHADRVGAILHRASVDPGSHRTWELHGVRGMMVQIDLVTGETTFGKAYDLDETAKAFWTAIGATRPVSPQPTG